MTETPTKRRTRKVRTDTYTLTPEAEKLLENEMLEVTKALLQFGLLRVEFVDHRAKRAFLKDGPTLERNALDPNLWFMDLIPPERTNR